MERRRFLQLSALALASKAPLQPRKVEAEEVPDSWLKLEGFIDFVKPRKEAAKKAAARFDIYGGLKEGVSPESRVEDIERYFEVYAGASIKYGVDWRILMIIHLDETAISRDERPGRNGFTGAMQRSGNLYPDHEAVQALDEWEFLKELNTFRYNDPVGSSKKSNDPNEIFWAAKYIHDRAKPIRERFSSDLEAQLYVLRNSYSAPKHGVLRDQWFRHISGVLD